MKRLVLGLVAVALLLTVAVPLTPANAAPDAVLQALRDELNRSMAKLALPDYAKPYFIAYRVADSRNYSAHASLGAILDEGGNQDRKVYVEVRVGDYRLDNTSTSSEFDRFDPDMDSFNYLQYIDLPIEDDADALRGRLWRLTDLRFKNALADYLRKRAKAVYRENPDEAMADFTRETPVKAIEPAPAGEFDKKAWRDIARQASGLLKQYPALLDTDVSVQSTEFTQYYVTSEGAELELRAYYFSFSAQGKALGVDGLSVNNNYTRYARTLAKLPTREEVLAGVRRMAEQLMTLRQAPVLEPYTGPAILDPTVAGVFFHEAIGHRLEGNRTRGADEGKTFKGKIGHLILPEFLDVVDDPTLAIFAGEELNGHYTFDDEGVAAQRVELVRQGVLKDFLRSRMPIQGFTTSNGHGRADVMRAPFSRMGNLIALARQSMPVAKLKEKLLALARAKGKPYGLWLRSGMGGETTTDQFNFQAFANRPVLMYRVDAKTGQEELVRGAELVGTPLMSINKVIAAGDDPGVFNGYCGAESGYIPVSAASPSLLVSEIELQRVQDKPTKPPVLPPPYAPANGVRP